MSVLVAIPARYASSRYPGKPLAELRGASGRARSLVRRSWEAAVEAAPDARVVVATDDDRIRDHASGFGAEVVMTPAGCRNGTERVGAVLDALGTGFETVVNLQGDAPLTPPWYVAALLAAMEDGAAVATPVLRAAPEHVDALRADRAAGRVGGTTAVVARDRRALYFSKEVMPHGGDGADVPVWHHVGLYAYTPSALAAYRLWPEGVLEKAEGLEQLRFLENGHPVRCVEVEAMGRPFWELNNPEDVPRIEAMMAEIGME
ncbi:MAG: 3-deoxy-manno-octulosonate cytidylyltransferase [Hasllibacter sp.]